MDPELRPVSDQSITEVFETHESQLLHFAYGYVKRRAVAEEIVQESFLRLHRQWTVVNHPRAWLYRCVRNLCLNHIRNHRRETIIPLPDSELGSTSESVQPDANLIRIEALGMVRELLSELPAQDRRLLELKYHEEKSYKHIAEDLDIGVGNVGYRLHHLLKRLGTSLEKAGIKPERTERNPDAQ